MRDPYHELVEIMKFVLGLESLEGTVIEQRIKEVLSLGKEATQVYKPRSGGINKNMAHYTEDQIQLQMSVNEEFLHYFGYVDDGR